MSPTSTTATIPPEVTPTTVPCPTTATAGAEIYHNGRSAAGQLSAPTQLTGDQMDQIGW